MKPLSSYESANLDFLRSVAVLCVFFSHLYGAVAKHPPSSHFGEIGVLMFFVHTSLVLMMSLQREHLNGPDLFINFYIRRFFRIYPLSIVCVLIIFLSRCEFRPFGIFRWLWTGRELFGNTLLAQNLMQVKYMLGVLWSLPLEVQMYVFLPFLFLLARSSRMRTLYLVWSCSVVLAIIQPHITKRLNVLSYAPCFLPGIVAWVLRSRIRPRLPAYLWPVTVFVMSLICLVGNLFQWQLYVGWAFCLLLGLAIPPFLGADFCMAE